jgi:predicted acetyltransferase
VIIKTSDITLIEPLYREYLTATAGLFVTSDLDAWFASAMKNLNRYAGGDNRHAFVLKPEKEMIGFALVNRHLRFNDDGHAVAEFFIRKEHERNGYGRTLAEAVFKAFPGNWEVAVSSRNAPALFFWRNVVAGYTGNRFFEQEIPAFSGKIICLIT